MKVHIKHTDKEWDDVRTLKITSKDVWSLNSTLAIIIAECLRKFRINLPSAASVDNSDVPDKIKRPMKDSDVYDVDEDWFRRWNWVLDEMIWTFTELSEEEPNQPENFGSKEFTDYQNRIDNGLRLFSKYYRGLWR